MLLVPHLFQAAVNLRDKHSPPISPKYPLLLSFCCLQDHLQTSCCHCSTDFLDTDVRRLEEFFLKNPHFGIHCFGFPPSLATLSKEKWVEKPSPPQLEQPQPPGLKDFSLRLMFVLLTWRNPLTPPSQRGFRGSETLPASTELQEQ